MLRPASPWLASVALHALLGLSLRPRAALPPAPSREPAVIVLADSMLESPPAAPAAAAHPSMEPKPQPAVRAPRAASGKRGVAPLAVLASTHAGADEAEIPAPPIEAAAAAPAAIANANIENGKGGSGQAPIPNQGYGAAHLRAIRDAVRRHMVYPAAARRMGWSGRVLIGFRVLPGGAVVSIRVVASSGIRALDESAAESVRRAAPLPGPPEAVDLVVPVTYEMIED